MSEKINFIDMTKPTSSQTDQEKIDKLIEQFSDIVFIDCTKGGLMLGLDTESTGVAVLAAAEILLWFSRISEKVNDEDLEKLRKKAGELAEKKREYFKETGIEDLIKSAGKVAQRMKARSQQNDQSSNVQECDSKGDKDDD